ncbi:MAG: MBL fold metallo-hydrolase [Spirochaetia bacterium]|nr:MBL fold metallo-hydrolase [Spirochaetia bacterium]
MEITFYGAARHVTGSCTLVRCHGLALLIDCGMPQGNDERDMGDDFLFDPALIDIVLLTHAHIDHTGRIPQLVKEGFKGEIWCTKATERLCEIMLADSGHIQEMEAEWKSRKQIRAGKGPVEPLYTAEDAQNSMQYFNSVDYEKVVDLGKGVQCRFVDAGHLLGSSSIELWLEEDGVRRKLVFSGDIGNFDQPIIKDPNYLDDADVVVIESTYGNRLHKLPEGAVGHNVPTSVRAAELAKMIKRTFDRGGNVIIPAFSVGRTQEILYLIRYIIDNKLLPEYSNLPVFVDSPLSVKATEIFASCVQGYYDKEAMDMVNKGINPIIFPSLTTITDVEQSKALNRRTKPSVIISSSGMCEAGRIKHHLKHNLWRKECMVIFSGYQAGGTLGNSILNGARHVTIFGEQIDVKCEICELEGISGHADQAGLITWLKAFHKEPQQVFVNHGEEDVAQWFAAYVCKELGLKAYAPDMMETFSLADLAKLPKQSEAPLPSSVMRQLEEALKELSTGRGQLENVIVRMIKASRNKKLEEKDAARLTNAVERLASDLDFLQKKWGGDADLGSDKEQQN